MNEAQLLLRALGADLAPCVGDDLVSRTPCDGACLATLRASTAAECEMAIKSGHEAFRTWRVVPAPRRGELVRLLGEVLREQKVDLARLVSLESGKILQEGLGEVQEMIDICDFAVGLSRQLYGLTIASERPGHRMMEQWHPLGVTAIISAFNFPVAVWAWNAAIALVCGNPIVWKPSEKTPLTALATQALFLQAVTRYQQAGYAAPAGLSSVLLGAAEVGERLVGDPRVALISATGSTRMGRAVAARSAQRFARTILELGGNNAMIVTPSADLEMAVRAIVFSAVGTCGQRCTSLRRLIVHRSVSQPLLHRLKLAYASLVIGHPLESGVLVGPLIDKAAFDAMQKALERAQDEGGQVTGGERVLSELGENAWYVRPALVELAVPTQVVREECFAPILYVMPYDTLDEAIAMQNDVDYGLSSCIFSTNVRECEQFLAAAGSDCGIANVNIGPSGAEIGGAFGGEKSTGGGRESGSDAWKAYMRRATNTVNWSAELPLAQGIVFDL